jgi:hypothetical protein
MKFYLLLVTAAGGFMVPKQNKPHYVTTGKRRKAARVMAPTPGAALRRFQQRFPDRNFNSIFEVVPMGM